MRYLIFIFFGFLSINIFCQITISATVHDAQTGEVLPYCNVSVVGTNKGTITNADGMFSISLNSENNVLEFSFLGYEKLNVQVSDIVKTREVYLIINPQELMEVEIHADNNYLYEIIVKSRKNLKQNYSQHQSKAYYAIETKATPLEVFHCRTSKDSLKETAVELEIIRPEMQEEITVELLECFYNAKITGAKVSDLKFRNGKVFSQPAENYFFSLNSSKAMGLFSFYEKNELFPSCPFQYSKIAMKRLFKLELLYFDGENYHIKFSPYNNPDKYFSGDVWIEKNTMQVVKINLNIESTTIYPLVTSAIVDTIENFKLNITNSYNPNNNYSPDYTIFNYGFDYISRGSYLLSKFDYKNVVSKMNSKGLIYYYDYQSPFLIPYFDFDYDYSDYDLMSLFRYNPEFWDENNIVQLTSDQKRKFELGLDTANSYKNYNEDSNIENFTWTNTASDLLSEIFIFWLPDKRIAFTKAADYKEYIENVQKTPFPADLCRLSVQILLDVNELHDSIICKSYTIFDTMRSVYKYPTTAETEAFINMYFDICEIERRKMQKKLEENSFTISEIDVIYNSTKAEMEKITKQFIIETDRGRDNKALQIWNKYVFNNLGIDNLKIERK